MIARLLVVHLLVDGSLAGFATVAHRCITPLHRRLPVTLCHDGAETASRYPYVRGDLRLRPIASVVALATWPIAGAVVGIFLIGPLEGVLLGSAAGWSAASLGDTIAAAAERRRALRQARDAEDVIREAPFLREMELEEQSDPRVVKRLNRLWEL